MRKYSILAAVVICLQAATVRAAEVVRVACVGDSITYGAGVANRGKNNYPKVLGGLLGAGYERRKFGVSGATLHKKGDLRYWRTDRESTRLNSSNSENSHAAICQNNKKITY